MVNKAKIERRRHSRRQVQTEVKLKEFSELQDEWNDFKIGSTENLSLSGLCCRVNKFILPLTKVEGLLVLPDEKGKGSNVRFTGVVVRSDPEKESKRVLYYSVAIFFKNILGGDQKKIQKYLNLIEPDNDLLVS